MMNRWQELKEAGDHVVVDWWRRVSRWQAEKKQLAGTGFKKRSIWKQEVARRFEITWWTMRVGVEGLSGWERGQRAQRAQAGEAVTKTWSKTAWCAAPSACSELAGNHASMKRSDLEEHGPSRPAKERTLHNSSTGIDVPTCWEERIYCM